MRPVLIVVAGPNGSGKTSITEQIRQHQWAEHAEYINPDELAQSLYGDWNDKENQLKAARHCEALREQYLREGKSLIFETVLSAPDKLDYIMRAYQAGYFVRMFFVCTESPLINIRRISKRVEEGGHDVDAQKVIDRYHKSIVQGAVISAFVDRAYLYDNSKDNVAPLLACRFSEGQLIKKYTEVLPSWVEDFIISE